MSNLGREDVERIVENVLQDLSIDVESDCGIRRRVVLSYKGREISYSWFTIEQESDYGG